jgi:FkbM family methyltransferase
MSKLRFLQLFKSLAKVFLKSLNVYYSNEKLFKENDIMERIHEQFIKVSTGILHIGGHKGQEASKYAKEGKEVIFVEAVPEFFEYLESHLMSFTKQKAVCALLGDQDIENVTFYLASNEGASSSIYNFGSEVGFSNLSMERSINLDMVRLDTLFSKADLANYNHWVIDVQGAELKVLQGSGAILENCFSIMVEISTRKVYENGVLFEELNNFLADRGFFPVWIPRVGVHQNLLYLRHVS